MRFNVKVTGVNKAARELRELPAALVANAVAAVNGTAEFASEFVVRRVGERYNLSEPTLRENVFVRRASVSADLVRGSVDLQIKAVPVDAFAPQVRYRPFRGPDARGRVYKKRVQPEVRIALYRDRRPALLAGGFPTAGGIRKRAGSGRGDCRDGTFGNKLTGLRYYTFPKRLTDKVLKETQRAAGKELALRFRVAYRKDFKGRTVLRQNS